MKKLFQQIMMGAKAHVPKPGVYNRNVKGRAAKLNPVPSYWALIPVRPQNLFSSKRERPFNEE